MTEPTPDLRALAAEEMRIATRGAMLASDREVLARGVLAAVLPKVAEQLTRRADAVPWSDPTLRRGIQYAASVVRSLAETHPATGPASTQPAQDALAVAEEAPNAAGPSEGAGGQRAPVNPYSDAISQHAFSLVFNGLTRAMTDAWWMPLSERMRASELIYETLRLGGVEIRLRDGLAELRAANEAIDPEAPNAPGPPEGATTHPRESARAWLAGQICAIEAGAQALEPPCGSCRWRADAILNGPGVKVEIDRIKRMPQEMGDDEPIEIRNPPAGMRPTHTQVVIRLPAQPIEDGHDG